MPGNRQYITSVDTGTGTATGSYFRIADLAATYNDEVMQVGSVKRPDEKGISPQLYFKYVKKKFGLLERRIIDKRIKTLEKAFDEAVDNGQDALAEKFVNEIVVAGRETLMFAKGVTEYVEREDLFKFKRGIRGGHISDTRFSEFTRVIPNEVLKKKKQVENLFDGFVIFHYWNEAAEKVRAGKQKMSSEEKGRMRDPILFGVIKENDRFYFIADWEDEHCDLTFDEIAGVIAKKKGDTTIGKIEAKVDLS